MYAKIAPYTSSRSGFALKLLQKEPNRSTPTSVEVVRQVGHYLNRTRNIITGFPEKVNEVAGLATRGNISLTGQVNFEVLEFIALSELILHATWNDQALTAPITFQIEPLIWEDVQASKQREQRKKIRALMAEWDSNPDDTPEEWWDEFDSFLEEHRTNLR
jgi:hypothetical protein